MIFSIFVQHLDGDKYLQRSYENMTEAIENVMLEFESQKYSITLWQDYDKRETEIVFLNEDFLDVYHIIINQKQKEEKSDALLLQ